MRPGAPVPGPRRRCEAGVIAAIIAGILAALICYAFLRRATYNLFDPLIVTNISIPLSAALLAALCSTELVTWDKLWLFAAVLLAYLLGARVVSAFFGRETLRQAIIDTLSAIRRNEINVILTVTVSLTLALAVLGLQAGAQGDARQEFGRIFRPALLFQNGLLLSSLILLLSPKLPRITVAAWLTALIVLSVPFSGKAVLFPVLYWFGVKLYLERRAITVRAGIGMTLVVLIGVAAMGLVAYGTSSATSAFLLITNRFWMSGDVYIYAYQANGLDAVRDNYPVSFLAYMMHPITSLVGMRAYDKPLGSMLASQVMRADLFTGPNPQLPVVIDYFFPGQLGAALVVAFAVGFLVIGIRPLGMMLARKTRNRYLRLGGIVAVVFGPAAGFLDTSQVLIALAGIVASCAFLIVLDLLFSRSAPAGNIPSPAPGGRSATIQLADPGP
jgi:hypothetical protein